MLLGAIAGVVGHAAILALLVPAEAAVGDVFRRQELKATQQHIVLGNFQFLAQNRDLNQPLIGTKKRARHAMTAHECSHSILQIARTKYGKSPLHRPRHQNTYGDSLWKSLWEWSTVAGLNGFRSCRAHAITISPKALSNRMILSSM